MIEKDIWNLSPASKWAYTCVDTCTHTQMQKIIYKRSQQQLLHIESLYYVESSRTGNCDSALFPGDRLASGTYSHLSSCLGRTEMWTKPAWGHCISLAPGGTGLLLQRRLRWEDTGPGFGLDGGVNFKMFLLLWISPSFWLLFSLSFKNLYKYPFRVLWECQPKEPRILSTELNIPFVFLPNW